MRRFAAAWLGVSLVIVNLKSLPPTLISIVFLVSILLVGLRVRCLRPILAGGLFSLFTLYVAFLQLASHQLHSDQISKDLTLTYIRFARRFGRAMGSGFKSCSA